MANLHSIAGRLIRKMQMSQTPVPGFIIGLSGTDSIIAFMIAYAAFLELGMAKRLLGVHYVNDRKSRWFETEIIPWLQERCPEAQIITAIPLGGNQDQQRWADLHVRALNSIGTQYDSGLVTITPLDVDRSYWVAGTINATEKVLGKYSLLASCVSIQLVQTLWKSTIMELCISLGVPQIAIDMAQIPDCLCGRDEVAAQNIKLIDDILTYKLIPTEHSPELLSVLFAYISAAKKENDFKIRIPYTI